MTPGCDRFWFIRWFQHIAGFGKILKCFTGPQDGKFIIPLLASFPAGNTHHWFTAIKTYCTILGLRYQSASLATHWCNVQCKKERLNTFHTGREEKEGKNNVTHFKPRVCVRNCLRLQPLIMQSLLTNETQIKTKKHINLWRCNINSIQEQPGAPFYLLVPQRAVNYMHMHL